MPSTYTPQQKAKIQQFTAVTSATDRSATKFLKAQDWNVQRAADAPLIRTPRTPPLTLTSSKAPAIAQRSTIPRSQKMKMQRVRSQTTCFVPKTKSEGYGQEPSSGSKNIMNAEQDAYAEALGSDAKLILHLGRCLIRRLLFHRLRIQGL
ncbi:MAG: hypothetical protein M1817_005777 [Caeruleum heppii]|nr:MAG: hypothetical protein M1817_005777 [Caeruleum heppii]